MSTAKLQFFKVNALPQSNEIVANAMYFVKHPTKNYAETYVSDNTGTLRSVGNSDMINALISEKVNQAAAALTDLVFAADIAERNNIIGDATINTMILVQNAAADPTVESGAAMYAFNFNDWESSGQSRTEHVIKIAEYESLDVTVSWGSITGQPDVTKKEVEDAVEYTHTHANKSLLDDLSYDSGVLKVDGAPVGGVWNEADW